jgi:hypothetical protein
VPPHGEVLHSAQRFGPAPFQGLLQLRRGWNLFFFFLWGGGKGGGGGDGGAAGREREGEGRGACGVDGGRSGGEIECDVSVKAQEPALRDQKVPPPASNVFFSFLGFFLLLWRGDSVASIPHEYWKSRALDFALSVHVRVRGHVCGDTSSRRRNTRAHHVVALARQLGDLRPSDGDERRRRRQGGASSLGVISGGGSGGGSLGTGRRRGRWGRTRGALRLGADRHRARSLSRRRAWRWRVPAEFVMQSEQELVAFFVAV